MVDHAKTRTGFTLVELVVVVMILGILAAIAAPKMLDTSQLASENGTRQTLGVIRNAIDSYAAENNGEIPGADGDEDTFKAELAVYLRGADFPTCPIGEAANNAVRMIDSQETAGSDGTAATHSWTYNFKTGDFFVNSQGESVDGETTYDQF